MFQLYKIALLHTRVSYWNATVTSWCGFLEEILSLMAWACSHSPIIVMVPYNLNSTLMCYGVWNGRLNTYELRFPMINVFWISWLRPHCLTYPTKNEVSLDDIVKLQFLPVFHRLMNVPTLLISLSLFLSLSVSVCRRYINHVIMQLLRLKTVLSLDWTALPVNSSARLSVWSWHRQVII